jgi:BNR repeat protein
MKRLFAILVIGAAAAILLVAQGTALASIKLVQLSSDPFTNATSQHRTEVEPDTFASGSTLVSAFQVGRFFGGGASDIGFATSTNGGTSFTSGFLPGTTPFAAPGGIYGAVSDASAAFDAKHGVWLISFLGLHPSGGNARQVDVLVSRSTDGGLTWSAPVPVDTSGAFNDKNWTVCDNTASSPFFGNCYTEFDVPSMNDQIRMSTSTDGGLTWGAAQPTKGHAHGIGGQPLVQPDGTVIVPIVGFAGSKKFVILSFTSTDGGASWSAPIQVSAVAFRAPAGGLRAGIPLPSAQIDASGKIYVVWSDCRFEPGCTASDLVLSTSTDGITWSPVTRIPIDPVGSGADHFIPGLAVDRSTFDGTAHLVLTFYTYPVADCTTSTCQLEVASSTSADGGATWTSSTQLAGPMTLTWLPDTSQGFMVADYLAGSFISNPAFPAFAVASAPSSGGSTCQTATPNCNQAMFTVNGGLSVAHGHPATDQTAAGASQTLTGSTLTAQ